MSSPDDPHAPAIAEHLRRQHAAVSDPPDPFAPTLGDLEAAPPANVTKLSALATIADEVADRIRREREAIAADPRSSAPSPVHVDPHANAVALQAELVELLEDGHELAAKLATVLEALGPVSPATWGARLAELALELPAGLELAVVVPDPVALLGAGDADVLDRLRVELIAAVQVPGCPLALKATADPVTDAVTLRIRRP